VLLIRVYGNKTDLLIDREAEKRNIVLLHKYGYAPRLFATFKNGLVYDYVPGVTLTDQTVIKPTIWPLIAKRMAQMHRNVNVECNTDKEPMLYKTVKKFLNLIPEQFSDPVKHSR
jgi:ethanolamine kinase